MIRAVLLLVCCQAALSFDSSFSKQPQQAQAPGQSPSSPQQQAASRAAANIAAMVRNRTNSWTAGAPRQPLSSYRVGVNMEDLESKRLKPGILILKEDVNLPEQFDARDKWPQCSSLREVRNQGCCGSCWAISAAEAFTDRWCIHSPEHTTFSFGAFDLLSCCHSCGSGCQGGTLGPAWEYWVQKGVSSGGPYNSKQGCHSYPFDVCHSPDEDEDAPKCSRKCQPSYSVQEVSKDRRFGRVAYSVVADEHRIMEEIYVNGPVQAAFQVFMDFKTYKSGVYRHVTGPLEGGHAVKILGWGVENGTKYWLCSNSWGEDWGDHGFFKIVRGENHLGIESDVHAGLPHYRKHKDMFEYDY